MHWIIDIIGGIALLVVGFVLGGTAAFYKGWDEGFREGYNKEIAERCGGFKVAARTEARGPAPASGGSDFPARKAS